MDIIEIIKVIFLGIVEGITEWLPVSSTGHMILFDSFVKLPVSEAFKEMFFVVIQLGAILAVGITFFNTVNPFSSKKSNIEKKDTWNLIFKILVACIPAGVIGLLFDDIIDEKFYNYITVAVTLIVYGILFIIIESMNKKPVINDLKSITYKIALYIGMFQILALIPGTSRSGATIVGALLLGVNRTVSSEFTFVLALPVMFGASVYKIIKYISEVGIYFTKFEIISLVIGMVVAFIVSIFTIKFLLAYIKKNDFKVFGYYRIILGILVILCGIIGILV